MSTFVAFLSYLDILTATLFFTRIFVYILSSSGLSIGFIVALLFSNPRSRPHRARLQVVASSVATTP